jgi:hypothetical protein
MDGIIVSNHGGRQVDGAVAALDALPGVVEAVADRVAVLFGSGIRTGADVIKRPSPSERRLYCWVFSTPWPGRPACARSFGSWLPISI